MTTTAPTTAGLRGGSPRDPGSARSRPRVRTVRGEQTSPAPRRRVSSLPFLGLIAGLLAAGLLGLLMINNSLAAGSFEQARLKSDRILLGEQEQALRQEVERLSSPTRVREAAQQAGLLPAATTAYFDVMTGQILGVPIPAGQAVPGALALVPGVDVVTVDPATGLPIDPAASAAIDPATGLPVPATSPAVAPDTAQPQPTQPAQPQPTESAQPPGAAAGEEADGAVLGGEPGGITAYDRAVVSGGGR